MEEEEKINEEVSSTIEIYSIRIREVISTSKYCLLFGFMCSFDAQARDTNFNCSS